MNPWTQVCKDAYDMMTVLKMENTHTPVNDHGMIDMGISGDMLAIGRAA